jgi:hypothetical protein
MKMWLSGEIRWFWKGAVPTGIYEWFMDGKVQGCEPGGGPPGREDTYLYGDDQSELGIKIRGVKGDEGALARPPGLSNVEVKGLIGVDWGVLTSGPFAGPVEFWCKWTFPRLDVGRSRRIAVKKTRWLRLFDTTEAYPVEIPLGKDEESLAGSLSPCLPMLGCNVEVTEVRSPDGAKWWSFALEAYGDRNIIADDLRAVASELTRRGSGPELEGGRLMSYPRWISSYVQPSEASGDQGTGR